MIRRLWAGTMLAAVSFVLYSAPANAQEFSAKFSGFNELGALNNETGAILSEGQGTLKLTLDKAAQTLTFELTYSNLSAPITQSHIHFGKVHVPGGIMVFFCSNLATAPAGTQACPNDSTNSGSVKGVITPSNVLALTGQNVTAGDFDALTDALNSNSAYGNIHTTKFPAGEIRGEVRREGHPHSSSGKGDYDHDK